MRHVDWCSIRFTPTSDPGTASALIPQGRLMLGQMIEGLQLVGQRTGVLRRELPDGSTIVVSFDGVTPVITIDTPTTEESSVDGAMFNLWVPRGLVVYPAWSDAPFGVGLPIIPDADEDVGPYDATNLAPGVGRARWTAGGPCGEVLISRDKNAGYPSKRQEITVPLLYDTTKGPVFRWNGKGSYDTRELTDAWTSYRMELAKPTAHYPDENVANVHALFEGINTYRVKSNLPALTLQPRGYYGPGEVMASIMQAAGSVDEASGGYPSSYRTSADRVTKDGYSAELAYGPYVSWARGDNPTTFELRAVGLSPADLLKAWQDDEPSNEIVTLDVGQAAFGNVGFRDGYWCADVISRTRWIEAGNCYWQSADADLPPVSWHGFASVNLAWETYPAQYDVAHFTTAPLVPLYAFTTEYGDCWLSYPRSTDPAREDIDPAMARHIYLRGRSIATTPRGGLVWGACIQAYEKTDDAGTVTNVDRLIALVHHPEDQPSDYTTNGWTRYLRVWWCDVPRREHLRADPQKTICGEDAADPWGWKGGDLIDVGHMPAPTGASIPAGSTSALKYASQWKFNANGTRAVCLRDYGLYTDYDSLYAVEGVQTKPGLFPRAVELQFNVVDETTTYTTATFHDYTPGAYAAPRAVSSPLDTRAEQQIPMYEHGAAPIAVDYDDQGFLVYAFTADIASYNYAGNFSYAYVGVGNASVEFPSDMHHRILFGAHFKTTDIDFVPSGVMVADVATGAFATDGVHASYFAAPDGSLTYLDPPCYPFTVAGVHGVRMYRRSELLDETWYPAPDGAVFSLSNVCVGSTGSGAAMVELPLSASRNVQVYLAERMGASVFATQVGPLPLAVRFLDAVPSDATCGCRMEVFAAALHSHPMTYAELNPRGGRVIANVPLPVNDWLIYAKVV